MNQNAKVLDQSPRTTPSQVAGSVVQPQMGSLNKEVPISTGLSELKASVPEEIHGIDQELTELGVREIKDRPDLTQISDVKHAGPSVPVPSGTASSGNIPLTREEALADLKTKKPTDSGWGFDKLVIKVLNALGFKRV